jgi:hypothetical protein
MTNHCLPLYLTPEFYADWKVEQIMVTDCCTNAAEIRVSKAAINFVRFEVFTAVTMKNGVFWDVTLRGSCNNRRFGGT